MATQHSRQALTAFTSGLLSPKLAGRSDAPGYFKGCSKLVNFLLMRQGGLRRRPGTIFVADGYSGAAPSGYDYMHQSRLIPFVVSETMGYIIEATTHLNASATSTVWRAFYDHTLVATINMGLSIGNIWDMQYVQVKEVMYFVGRDMPPTKLTYLSAASWAASAMVFVASNATSSLGTLFNTSTSYPGCITHSDGRLMLASTLAKGNTLWGSRVDSLTDFVLGTTADTAFEFPMAAHRASKIEWIARKDELVMGTGAGEIVATGAAEEGITPLKFFAKWVSAWPVASIQPQIFQDAMVFVQQGGMIAREFYWQDGYNSPELTSACDQIAGDFMELHSSVATAGVGWNSGERGFQQFDIQSSPEPILWFVRKDGKLVAMVYDKASGVNGWAEMEFGGYPGKPTTDNVWFGDAQVGSVAVVPSTDGEDEVWLSMMRWTASTADIAYRPYIEYMAPSEYKYDRDGHFVDCGIDTTVSERRKVTALNYVSSLAFTFSHQDAAFMVSGDTIRFEGISQDSTWADLNRVVYVISGVATSVYTVTSAPPSETSEAPTAVISLGEVMKVATTADGLDHLEGFTVAVNVDGMAVADQVVSGGSITLPVYGNRIHAGIPYTSKMKTMDLGVGSAQGTLGKIGDVVIRFWRSLGGKIGRDEDETLEDIRIKRVGTGSFYGPEDHFSGDVTVGFPSGYGLSRYVYIEQSQPLPMHILAIIPDVYSSQKG